MEISLVCLNNRKNAPSSWNIVNWGKVKGVESRKPSVHDSPGFPLIKEKHNAGPKQSQTICQAIT